MSYKTIMVYFPHVDRVPALMNVALPLALAQGAHLVGITVIPPIDVYAALAREYSPKVFEAEEKMLHGRADAIANEFAKHTKNQGVPSEWRCIEAGVLGIDRTVVELAASTDLVITSQANPEEDWMARSGVPESLLFNAKRPTILVPFNDQSTKIGHRVLIGWNGRGEASRATFDALPILRQADYVELTTIDTPSSAEGRSFTPADDIATALARHDVPVEVHQVHHDNRTDGEVILDRVKHRECDLLVIGGYGHNRFREFVFGGITQHVLMNMTTPVFLSH